MMKMVGTVSVYESSYQNADNLIPATQLQIIHYNALTVRLKLVLGFGKALIVIL